MIYPAYILLYWFDHLAFSSYHDNKSECLHRNRNRHVLSFVPKYHKNILRSRRIHSTDYFRLKNITFGITLPKEWTNKINIGNVRFYASASNLWTWAAYDNYDPEAVSAGSATQTTPPLKTVTFGLNINF